MPGLALHRFSAPTEHDAIVYVPSLCLVVQGAKELLVGNESYRYDPARYLLVWVDMPASARIVDASQAAPLLALRISLDLAIVADLLAGGTEAPDGPPTRGLGVSEVDAPLLDAVFRFVSLLDAPHDIAALAPLVHREIVYRVLRGPQGPRLRQIAAGTPARRVADAIQWLKEHYTEALGVDALARRSGLKTSAFHQHFKGVTGLSPIQYQKRLRLQEARRLMLTDGRDAAEAAFRVGYESPSQFSREYRRLFGAPPKKHVATVRAA